MQGDLQGFRRIDDGQGAEAFSLVCFFPKIDFGQRKDADGEFLEQARFGEGGVSVVGGVADGANDLAAADA